MQQFGCDEDIASNCVIDAFETMIYKRNRGETIREDNIRGLIVTIAKNNYLKQLKQNNNNFLVDFEALTILLNKQGNVEEKVFENETTEAEKTLLLAKNQAFQMALNKLSDKCKTLLEHYYIYGYRLTDLVDMLDYSSNNVIRDKRRTCYQQLQKWANTFLSDK